MVRPFCAENPLPPLFIGDGGGFPLFGEKRESSPRPSATPLINAGGKKSACIDSQNRRFPWEPAVFAII